MKIIELTKNLLITLTNEETDLLNKFDDNDVIAKRKLTEREQVIATNLTMKDVLQRTNADGQTQYKKRTS